jgi:hypothetical protein
MFILCDVGLCSLDDLTVSDPPLQRCFLAWFADDSVFVEEVAVHVDLDEISS